MTSWVDAMSLCLARRGLTEFNNDRLRSFIRGMYGYMRVPKWFVDIVTSLHAMGACKQVITESVHTLMKENPKAAFSNPVFARGGRMGSLVLVWVEFCAKPISRGEPQACMYDPQTKEWELMADGKASFFRYMLLQSLNEAKGHKLELLRSRYIK